MKVNKTLCLDVEVVRLLKNENNASLIINSYLRNYYGLDKPFVNKVNKEEPKEDIDKLFKGEII